MKEIIVITAWLAVTIWLYVVTDRDISIKQWCIGHGVICFIAMSCLLTVIYLE